MGARLHAMLVQAMRVAAGPGVVLASSTSHIHEVANSQLQGLLFWMAVEGAICPTVGHLAAQMHVQLTVCVWKGVGRCGHVQVGM